jgi:2-keto-3-deoxy-L-rhamnonate aldolase RhmA
MKNLLRDLKRGKILLGMTSMYPAAGIIERIGPDWDFVWIDGQHGQHDYRSLIDCVRAADIAGVETLIRVPGHDAGWIGRALDLGASAVMVPQVDTGEQAECVVKAAKFPPAGRRSFGGRRAIDLNGREYAHTANDEIALVVQIESKTAVENAEDILSVKGIDVFFFGPDDMAMEHNLPMDRPRSADKFQDIMKKLIRTADKYGVIGGGVFGTPEALSIGIALGYRLIGIGSDTAFLSKASGEHRERMRSVLSAEKKTEEKSCSREKDSI